MANDKGNSASKTKKCSTAEKRMKQNAKRNLRRRSFKSRVRTAIRTFETALSSTDKPKIQSTLQSIYSLMDKGVKIGIYKKNKAARTKSHVALMHTKAGN